MRNLYGEEHDLWSLNTEEEYLELEVSARTRRTDLSDDVRHIATTQARVPRRREASG